MKKSIIITSLTLAISVVTVIGFTNRTNNETSKVIAAKGKINAIENFVLTDENKDTIPNLYYGVDSRFEAIKLFDTEKATTIYDFLNANEKAQIKEINTVEIIVIENNQQSNQREYGTSDQLTDAQLHLLKSKTYFEHFTIRTEFKGLNEETGLLESRFFGPHFTIVPEHQAHYKNGKEALINYLKENSKSSIDVITNQKLGAVKISFIVTKDGKVSKVKYDAMTTGYKSLDEKLLELIKHIPGEWTPAKNKNGEIIEQELVFTFGPADGC